MLPNEFTIKLRPRSLLIGALLSPFAVVLAIWVFSWPWSSSNASGWVQAVGSLIGLGIALWLPWREGRRRESDDFRKNLGLTRRLYYTAHEINGRLEFMFPSGIFKGFDARSDIESMSRVLVRLNTTFDDDHDPRRVALTHQLRQNLPAVIANLDKFSSKQGDGEEALRQLWGYYKRNVELCWKEIVKLEQGLPANERTKNIHDPG
ncbi:hypothetical protein [Pseudomonas knackmussii]|uniref:hypothetical protein n=1 Tax=Pseudomonas knackmussii TaxID=65741 RepID=UPI0012EBE2F4|nr:hypothetical protein [Pseudomonas knackmussii]